jgi:hypothetical protein
MRHCDRVILDGVELSSIPLMNGPEIFYYSQSLHLMPPTFMLNEYFISPVSRA